MFFPPRGCFDPNTLMSRCSCLFWGKEWLLYGSVTSFKIKPIIAPLLLLLHPTSNSRYNYSDSSYFALVFFRKYQKGALHMHSGSLLIFVLFWWCFLELAPGWKLIISVMSVCSTSFLMLSYCLATLFLQLCLWGNGPSETAWCANKHLAQHVWCCPQERKPPVVIICGFWKRKSGGWVLVLAGFAATVISAHCFWAFLNKTKQKKPKTTL